MIRVHRQIRCLESRDLMRARAQRQAQERRARLLTVALMLALAGLLWLFTHL